MIFINLLCYRESIWKLNTKYVPDGARIKHWIKRYDSQPCSAHQWCTESVNHEIVSEVDSRLDNMMLMLVNHLLDYAVWGTDGSCGHEAEEEQILWWMGSGVHRVVSRLPGVGAGTQVDIGTQGSRRRIMRLNNNLWPSITRGGTLDHTRHTVVMWGISEAQYSHW